MSSRCTYLMQYFSDRYVLIKDDWLSTVIDFLYEKVPESRRFPDEKFSNLVFDQWAWADFSTTSFPAFANHGINEQATKQELQSPIVCQVNSCIDVGSPYYAQFCSLKGGKKEDNSGFETIFHEKEEDFDAKPSRLLKLTLTDGESNLNAIEFWKCPELSLHLKPGSKISIFPPCLIRNGKFLLKPQNFQVLGGGYMPFENSHHPLQQYARILGIKDFKVAKENENRQNTSLSKAPNNSTPRQLPPIVPSANLNRYLVKNPPPASVYTTSIPSTSKPVENQEVYLDLSDENNIECDSDSNDSFNNWHRSQTNQSHNRKSFENSVHVSSLLSRIQEDENDDNDDIFNRNTQRLAKKRASVGERVSLKAQTTFCRDSGTLSSRRINPMDELLELQIEKDEEPVNFSDQNKILNPFKNLPSAKRIKVEKEEEDDDIQIIEMVPPPKQNVEIVEKETDNEQEEYGPEERAALASFSKLRLSNLNGSLKKMKYSIGSKRFQILAIIEDINEPLRVVDNLWTMKVEVSDDSESKKLAFIDNQILEKLIGYTCAEAIAIRKSSDLEKRKDGKRRLEALEHQLLRLDLIFEIEFFPEATLSCPVIRSMETLSEYLDVY